MPVNIRHAGEQDAEVPRGNAGVAERSLANKLKFLLPVPPVTISDKILFADNLATILDAGLSIHDSLDILQDEAKNARMREILGNLKVRVRAGQPFWTGLEAYGDVFPPLFVGLVKVGESSGRLVEVLERLSEKLRKEFELRGKIIAAATYPAIVATAMVAVAALTVAFVIPKLAEVFRESGADLPLQTRMLIGVSDFTQAHWPAIGIAVCLLAIFAVVGRRVAAVRAAWHRIVLRLPIVGPVAVNSELVWFATNFRSLLASGFPVVESFDLLSQTAVNTAYRDAFRGIGARVSRGVPVAEALQGHPRLFPALFHRMVRVGEATGRLDETLKKLARHYETKLDAILSNVAALLNPALTIVIGGFVALMALAIIMPIYQLIGAFN